MSNGHSPRQTLRAVIAFALAYLMAWGGVPVPALAKMAEEAMTEKAPAVATKPSNISVEGGQTNDELLNAYVQHKLDEPLAQSEEGIQLGVQSAKDALTATQKKAYDEFKQFVSDVAAGDVANATLTIPAADLMDDCGPWSASDLGVGALVNNGQLAEEASDAVSDKVGADAGAVIFALMADCPYELYWFDKRSGCDFSVGLDWTSVNNEWCVSVTSVEFEMSVSADYSANGQTGTTQVDTGKTTHVNTVVGTAVAEAQRIVTANTGLSNLKRLEAYKNAICTATSYNTNAAQSSTMPYGDPWQLIWVFDKDVNTNVVCEGYAKAFKYLCDLTWTGDDPPVECLLVSGTMTGSKGTEPHMWNVVRMDDGKSYLVDVTNCDEGAAGAPDKLFMAYGLSGTYDTKYSFDFGDTLTISYKYDSETMGNFTEEALTISSQQYQPPKTPVDAPAAVTGLVYDGTELTGVIAGTGYSLQGNSAANAGDHTAVATLDEDYVWSDGSTGTKEIPWSIAPKPVGISWSGTSFTYDGKTHCPTATATGLVGNDSVSVTVGGAQTNAGTHTATAQSVSNANYCLPAEKSVRFTIAKAVNTLRAQPSVTLSKGSTTNLSTYVSDGNGPVTYAIEEALAGCLVTSAGSFTAGTTAGTCKVGVSAAGDGNHEPGSVILQVNVLPDMSDATVEFRDGDGSGVYDGKAKTPVVTVALSGGTLTPGTDYEVEYENNVNAGTATVQVRGVGTYTGTTERNFSIARRQVTVTARDASKEYGSLDPQHVADVVGTVGSDKVGYTLSRAKGEVLGSYDITPVGEAVQGNYDVRFVRGRLTIVRAQLSSAAITAIPEQTHTGSPVTPALTVRLGSTTLRAGVDYTVAFANNTNVGTATATVTGRGNYTGTKSVEFRIVAAPKPAPDPDPTPEPAPEPDPDPTPEPTPEPDPDPDPTPDPAPSPVPARTFPDVVADAWYAGVVGRAAGLGLINGYKDGRFGPNDNVTRGQVAVILWNMAGKPSLEGTPKTFPDVEAGKYYHDAVTWASSVGVVNGYKDGRFGPDDLVTREQLAVMLANYAHGKGSAADYGSMRDAGKVSSWAASSVGWCFKNKIISGTKDGRVNPQGNATRAETAKMVVFLHDML